MKPRVITLQSVVESVPSRWDEAYPQKWADADKLLIGTQLRAAQAAGILTAESIAEIIGNDSWTVIRCDACNMERLPRAVIVGEEPYYDSATATLCEDCCRAALNALLETAP